MRSRRPERAAFDRAPHTAGLPVATPALTSPDDGTPTSDGTVGASVVTNQGSGRLYWAVVTDGGAATNAQIIAGTGGNIVAGAAGNQAVGSGGTQTIATITGLASATAYQIKFLHVNGDGTQSNQSSVNLTTL